MPFSTNRADQHSEAQSPDSISKIRRRALQRSQAIKAAKEERAAVDGQEATERGKHPDGILAHLSMKPIWFGVSFAVFGAIMILPIGADLSFSGQISLAVLGFAVIMWVTEAVTYPVSAVMIIGLLTISLTFAPALDGSSTEPMGSSTALGLALGGFSSSAVALVAAALALAAAMQATGLHKRLALLVLRLSGEKTSHILVGAIVISIVLAFFVPSATARAGAVVPILLGMVAAFGLATNSRLGALLLITAVQAVSIWNVGIKTAAAQNLVAVDFLETQMGTSVSWGQWFLWAAPWSAIMSVALYFVMRWAIRPEVDTIAGGREVISRDLDDLGKLSGKELRLIIVSVALLALWATEGTLHPFDSATVTIIAIGFLLTPKVGVLTWKSAEKLVNWGTLVVFAVGISLGTVLLSTGAAQWLSERTFGALGIADMPLLAMIALVSAFTILIHLGFASATSLSSALIPVFIALAASIPNAANGGIGFVIIQQFLISFGFLLPVSAPQNMLAYGTGAFTTKQFLRAGIPLTVIGYLLVLLFSATYWKWIGLI